MEPNRSEGTRRQLVGTGLLVEGGLGALACLLGGWTGPPVSRDLRWDAWDVAWGTAACIPMLLAFGVCLRWPVGPLSGIKRVCNDVIRPLFAPCSLFDLALISLTAGFGEELLFRGWLQGFLGSTLNPWLGLTLASVTFGLLHPLTPAYVVIAAGMGAYLGIVRNWNGNLLTVSVAHGLYDFLILAYLVRRPPHP